jgi:hypothetical protein
MNERRTRTEMTRKGKPPKVLRDKTERVDLQDLLGDENAHMVRGRSFRLGLPFGEAAITTTCEVELTCNQSRRSMLAAAKAAEALIDEVLEDDIRSMPKLLEKHRRSDED